MYDKPPGLSPPLAATSMAVLKRDANYLVASANGVIENQVVAQFIALIQAAP